VGGPPSFTFATSIWPTWSGNRRRLNVPEPQGLSTGRLRVLALGLGIGAQFTDPNERILQNRAIGPAFQDFVIRSYHDPLKFEENYRQITFRRSFRRHVPARP
jgi:hypothetical protein